jgi:hypothetical protein
VRKQIPTTHAHASAAAQERRDGACLPRVHVGGVVIAYAVVAVCKYLLVLPRLCGRLRRLSELCLALLGAACGAVAPVTYTCKRLRALLV